MVVDHQLMVVHLLEEYLFDSLYEVIAVHFVIVINKVLMVENQLIELNYWREEKKNE